MFQLSGDNDPALKTAATTGLQKLTEAIFKSKKPHLSGLLHAVNAVFDTVSLEESSSKVFKDTLAKIEAAFA